MPPRDLTDDQGGRALDAIADAVADALGERLALEYIAQLRAEAS